uniref:2'-phosphotransferase n=1 Tax=Sus scrofa TaxID=9823 RepID=A0A8D1UXV1_PIG
MGRSLRVFTCYCSSQDLAMNSGGRRQEAAGPRGRRAHRPREQVPPLSTLNPAPSVGGQGRGDSEACSLGNAGGGGVRAEGSCCSQGAQGLQPLWSPSAGGHSGFRVSSRAGSPQGLGATSGLFQDRDVQLSKALSYALRHGALKLGLPMGADGFVPLGALLQLPQFRSFSAEDVQRVVDTNEKQRFTLQPGDPSTGPLIRANQGHSLQVPALELIPLETPQALPLMLVHGTFWRHWPSILLKGLSRQGRTHIHLAPGLPGDPGVISGQCPPSYSRPLCPPWSSSKGHGLSCPGPAPTLLAGAAPSSQRAQVPACPGWITVTQTPQAPARCLLRHEAQL